MIIPMTKIFDYIIIFICWNMVINYKTIGFKINNMNLFEWHNNYITYNNIP